MIHSVSEMLLSQLSEFVAEHMGLHFPRERRRDLERGIDSAARELGLSDREACIRWLLSSPLTRTQVEILASHLTVGETYFFREKNSFEILQEHILPELIRSRRGGEQRLRIWSAGCATGEEPYSIAILLTRLIPDLRDWNTTLLATDINPRFLQKAAEGVYSDWSFRDAAPWVRGRYFKKNKEGRFEVVHQIKQMVAFSYLNLAEDVYPSLWSNTNAMDVIFCRNVLMYFSDAQVQKVIQNLYRCLVRGGWLIVSPTETSHVRFSQFETVNFSGAILYQKDSRTENTRIFSADLSQAPALSAPPSPIATELKPAVDSPSEWSEPRPSASLESKATDVELNPHQEALSQYEQGRYAEAAEKLVAILSQKPEDAKAMALLAHVHANQGHLAEAFGWCERAIAADKLNAGCHYLRAIILQEQGALKEAGDSLRRTLYLDPDFVLAHLALGNLARREGNFKVSAKYFENALSLLRAYGHGDTLPESEGITAGRLAEIIRSTIHSEISA